jgi:large subunit ribosomal protein L35
MPKMKTHSGAKKRFKVTGTGKLKRRSANLNHIMEKKTARRTRRLSGYAPVDRRDADRINRMLGRR